MVKLPATKDRKALCANVSPATAAMWLTASQPIVAFVVLVVPFQRMSMYSTPFSVVRPLMVRVNVPKVFWIDQFVGSVPGEPATAHWFELLRTVLVRASSTSTPLSLRRKVSAATDDHTPADVSM